MSTTITVASDGLIGTTGARPGAIGFLTDTTLCIGCKACEVACKQWNQLPMDEFGWTGFSYDNTGDLGATTWRHVAFIEHITAPSPLEGEGWGGGQGGVSSPPSKGGGRGGAAPPRSSLSRATG